TYKIVFPTISSIVMAPASITTLPSTTNLNNVNFTVTFSEPVLGIDAEDFAVDSTNTTVSGASITGVTTTDNTVYTVAVNTGTGNGTVDGEAAGSAAAGGGGVATVSTYDPAALAVAGHHVQASFADATISGSTYTASTSGTQTLSVSTATVTVTFTAADKIYDGNN